MQNTGEKPSIRKNFVMNAILTMSSFIFPLITFPYVSRTLLAEGSGKVTFATSLIAYFTMIAELGIPTYGIRACAQVRDDKKELSKVTQELLIINLTTAAISYALFLICLSVVPKMQAEKTLMLVTSSMILLSSIGMEWLYKSLEKYSYITVRSIIFKLISVIALFFLVRSQEDYVIYGAISVFASNASYVLNFLNARKYVSLKPVGNYNFSRHLKPILIFFAMVCATTIYNQLDAVMLGFLTTDADVGYYNVAVKVKLLLVSIVTSLGTVMLPRVSYYVQRKEFDRFYAVCNKAINFIFVASVPLCMFFMAFADRAVSLLSGPAFAPAVPAMRIVLPTVFLIGLNNILAIQMLVPLGREKTVFYAELVGAAADLVLDLFLIPRYKSAGAAFGTLIAETLVTLICYIALRKKTAESIKNVSYWKIAVSLLSASLPVLWLKAMPWGDFVTLAAGAILFFGVYLAVLYLLKENLSYELIEQYREKIVRLMRKKKTD